MTHLNQRGSPPHGAVRPDTHILIVDSDRQVAISLGFMLSARGFEEVRAVRSPARALAIAGTFHPAIVFLDIEIPDLAGLDLANRLRHGSRQHGMRLIALTSGIEHPKREDARSAGFERYLVKPLSQSELDKVLRIEGNTAG
jgi:two-component system, OmpR family, KDP operon response regulator KdpE